MFEGLVVPWHLLILVAVVFVAVGPRRLVRHFRHTSDGLHDFINGTTPDAQERDRETRVGPSPTRPSCGIAYRIGRRLRHRS